MAVTSASVFPPSTWTHLVATYGGTTFRLYANASLASTRANTGNIAASTSPLRIGGNAVWGEDLSGFIDDVRLYNRALSVPEIQADMATPLPAERWQPAAQCR
jgi:hypothetical protein